MVAVLVAYELSGINQELFRIKKIRKKQPLTLRFANLHLTAWIETYLPALS